MSLAHKIWIGIFLVAVMVTTIWVPLNHTPLAKIGNTIQWDAEGYYAYLPATFVYGLEEMPRRTFIENGKPYLPDYPGTHKIFIKYTCGMALLVAPFWLIAHGIALLFPATFPPDGMNGIYMVALLFADAFYLVLGFWFCYLAYRRKLSLAAFLAASLSLWLGTSMLFYSSFHPGYAHTYSFCAFAVVLWLTPQLFSENKWWQWLLLGWVYGLIVLIRPINGVIGLYVLLYDFKNITALGERITKWLRSPKVWTAAAFSLLPFVPQFLYWYMLSGHLVLYSYGTETFSNWKDPMLFSVLFSTTNGLFVYAPIVLVAVLAGLFLREKEMQKAGIWAAIVPAWYFCAAWWCWWFGTCYGYRPLIEFYALLILPLGMLYQRAWRWPKLLSIPFFAGAALLVFISVRMMYFFWGYWEGPDWTWESVRMVYRMALFL
ncbi:MAG: hypothetical protein U0T73_05000 [Chitinophagales bacterium]